MICKKTLQGTDYLEILNNIDQIYPDQTLHKDISQILNTTETTDTKDKQTAPNSQQLLNDIQTPKFKNHFFLLKVELYALKLSHG